MIDPRNVHGFDHGWCSFVWFLGWALDQFPAASCKYLEWGPGWSTIYVLKRLPPENMYSVESEQEWFNKYSSLGVNMILREAPKSHEDLILPEWADPFPGERFNVVLVDGHWRRDECVSNAAHLISSDGFVIVHDTWDCKPYRKAALGSGLKVLVDLQTSPGAMLLCRKDYQPHIAGLIIGPTAQPEGESNCGFVLDSTQRKVISSKLGGALHEVKAVAERIRRRFLKNESYKDCH